MFAGRGAGGEQERVSILRIRSKRMNQLRLSVCVVALGLVLVAGPTVSVAQDSNSLSEVSNFSLQAARQDEGGGGRR